MENHHFSWENPLFLWPFSIAMLNYQRVFMEINRVFFKVGCRRIGGFTINHWEYIKTGDWSNFIQGNWRFSRGFVAFTGGWTISRLMEFHGISWPPGLLKNPRVSQKWDQTSLTILCRYMMLLRYLVWMFFKAGIIKENDSWVLSKQRGHP